RSLAEGSLVEDDRTGSRGKRAHREQPGDPGSHDADVGVHGGAHGRRSLPEPLRANATPAYRGPMTDDAALPGGRSAAEARVAVELAAGLLRDGDAETALEVFRDVAASFEEENDPA